MALASPLVKRISGSKNFLSSPQKDLCNNIGTNRTNWTGLRMFVVRGRSEAPRRGLQGRFWPKPVIWLPGLRHIWPGL